jgi:REP element-mobilizing transposase RayT
MSTFTKLVYHVAFETKWRSPLITRELKTRLYEYLGGIIRGKSGHLVEVGGVADHIHLLVHLSPKFAVSDVVREFKGSSSAWVNTEKLSEQHFEWQKGCPPRQKRGGLQLPKSQDFSNTASLLIVPRPL